MVISSKGASGDFPGCTDLAYQGAISDGVDILDCPVQMTKDGIAICLGSINLLDSTLVAQSPFSNLTTTISELGISNGIFTFSLTWSQIQTLTRKLITSAYFVCYFVQGFANLLLFLHVLLFVCHEEHVVLLDAHKLGRLVLRERDSILLLVCLC